MDIDRAELRGLLDRERVRDCIVRLARGEDRRDATVITAAYWPDARNDYGVFEGDFDAYLAWVVPGSPAIANTQHILGQSLVELDGDAARVETHVISYHRIVMPGGDRDMVIAGRYLDRCERRGGEWRIAGRTMLYDWSQDFGHAVDWSQGLMGTPLSGPHYSGRAVGDHSEVFFGLRP